MTDTADIFKPIEQALQRAEITMVEAAEILPVSRGALYNWKTGKHPNNDFIYRFCLAIAAKLEAAVKRGDLPLDGGLTHDERIVALKQIIGGK
jgi:hypothetical protein